MAKLSIQELKALKRKRQIIITTAEDANTAKACELAGIDNIVAFDVPAAVKAAPNILVTGVISFADARISNETAIKSACELVSAGAGLVYTMDMMPERVETLAKQGIGCVGHAGLVPYLSTWFGGLRAVGKTAKEALAIYEKAKTLQDAGAIAIEMECVPALVAEEISKRLEILVFSMGSGSGCDGQYVFSSDLFGSHDGHYPRHAIRYGNFYDESIKILKQFKGDVETGVYPAERHTIPIHNSEFERFLEQLEKRT